MSSMTIVDDLRNMSIDGEEGGGGFVKSSFLDRYYPGQILLSNAMTDPLRDPIHALQQKGCVRVCETRQASGL